MEFLIILLVVGFVVLLVQGVRREAILRRIEAQLESIATKAGVPFAPDASGVVREFARRGDIAGAAATYRADTGVDMKYAQAVARRLAREATL